MDFPHLNDTRFPNIENVDVYAHQVVFDYTRWQPKTKAYLCNVRWNGDYEDCVKFEDDAARDAWFDELVEKSSKENPDCAIVFELATVVVQNQVKVPVPYDRAAQFNYLVVDVPVMTSDDAMLPYETKDGYRRWHFFVEDFDATTPSTTRLGIRLDYWTQYINSVGFSYFLLERGHAPAAAIDTDTYLSNPMENNEYLLTADVDFGGSTIARDSQFIPFGNGEKAICFASTCTPTQLASIGTVRSDSASTFSNPIFSDEPNYPDSSSRWGRQYHVDGYGYGSGKDYSNVTTPTGNVTSPDGRIPNNVSVYAIKATSANDFINAVMSKSPTFLKTLVACFMVDTQLVTMGTAHNVAGYTVYECVGNTKELGSVKLTKDMFGIPERYQKFAKLYTFPYSELEVTDNNGESVTVRVEETGNVSAHAITSVAYPYLNMRLFLTGIGGKGSKSYTWKDLRGSHDAEISNSDWFRFCFDMEIPTYALYMDGQTSWEINNYNRSLSNARNSALVNYHNSVREANNAYHNSLDNNATANTNSRASALTNRNNTVNLSNTSHTNTNNDANTMDTNNANIRACNTDVTANNNACMTANMNEHNALDRVKTVNEDNRAIALAVNARQLSEITTTEENNVTTASANANQASAIGNGVAGIVSGTLTGAAAGAAGGAVAIPGIGAVPGAVVGGTVGGVAAAVNMAGSVYGASTNISVAQSTTNANTTIAAAQNANNDGNNADNQIYNNYNLNQSITTNQNVNTNNVNTSTANTNRNNDLNKSNTDNTTATMRTNATNIDNTYTNNANNTRDTSYANADRIKSTGDSNSDWTDRVAIANAQDVLRNTQNNARATLYDSRNASPVKLTDFGGNPTSDYMRTRGVQVKVRTQSDHAIRCAGDEFTRYGYALNQVWDVSDLRIMKHFTYWKAKDCWVYDKCETSDLAQTAISVIFKQGVTVWSDPSEIGRVNPYDN